MVIQPLHHVCSPWLEHEKINYEMYVGCSVIFMTIFVLCVYALHIYTLDGVHAHVWHIEAGVGHLVSSYIVSTLLSWDRACHWNKAVIILDRLAEEQVPLKTCLCSDCWDSSIMELRSNVWSAGNSDSFLMIGDYCSWGQFVFSENALLLHCCNIIFSWCTQWIMINKFWI